MSQRYTARLSRSARRALEFDLPEKIAAAVVEFLDNALSDHSRPGGKPLRDDLAGKWSVRRGGYRVVYMIEDEIVTVEVLRIDHRRDVWPAPRVDDYQVPVNDPGGLSFDLADFTFLFEQRKRLTRTRILARLGTVPGSFACTPAFSVSLSGRMSP